SHRSVWELSSEEKNDESAQCSASASPMTEGGDSCSPSSAIVASLDSICADDSVDAPRTYGGASSSPGAKTSPAIHVTRPASVYRAEMCALEMLCSVAVP